MTEMENKTTKLKKPRTMAAKTDEPKATAPKKIAAKSNVTEMKAPQKRASHEEIAKLAHLYWLQRGRQHGHDAEDWFRAERELIGMAS
jgi:hypothetical protein